MSYQIQVNAANIRMFCIQAAMYLMLGSFLGFLFFLNVFPYYISFSDSVPIWWVFVLGLIAVGFLAGYLYPDISHVLASAILFPVLGAIFCFAIFLSPTLTSDIMASNVSEDFFMLIRLVIVNIFLAFIVILVTGFLSLYFFDPADR